MDRDTGLLVRLPPLGEGLTRATVAAWHVTVGDHVVVSQTLVTVQTAKIAVDVPSPAAGQVVALIAAVNSTVGVGDPLLRLG